MEDAVLVGADHGEVLTAYPRSLERAREAENSTDIGMLADGG